MIRVMESAYRRIKTNVQRVSRHLSLSSSTRPLLNANSAMPCASRVKILQIVALSVGTELQKQAQRSNRSRYSSSASTSTSSTRPAWTAVDSAPTTITPPTLAGTAIQFAYLALVKDQTSAKCATRPRRLGSCTYLAANACYPAPRTTSSTCSRTSARNQRCRWCRSLFCSCTALCLSGLC